MARLKKLCADRMCASSTICLRHPDSGAYHAKSDQEFDFFDRKPGGKCCTYFVRASDFQHLWEPNTKLPPSEEYEEDHPELDWN